MNDPEEVAEWVFRIVARIGIIALFGIFILLGWLLKNHPKSVLSLFGIGLLLAAGSVISHQASSLSYTARTKPDLSAKSIPVLSTMTDTPIPTRTPTSTFVMPTPQPTVPRSDKRPFVTVTAVGLNIRSGPGTSYPVIGELAKNDRVIIDGTDESGNWLQFDYRGQTGWIAATFTTYR